MRACEKPLAAAINGWRYAAGRRQPSDGGSQLPVDRAVADMQRQIKAAPPSVKIQWRTAEVEPCVCAFLMSSFISASLLLCAS